MPERVAAIEIGCSAAAALGEPASGRVAAVFERSIYVATHRHWLCIGAPSIGTGPLNVRMDLPEGLDWRASGLAVGDPVEIGRGRMRIARHWSLRLDAASIWTPRAPGAWSGDTLRRGLKALERIVDGQVPDQGLGRLIGGSARGARLPAVAAAARGPLAALGRVVGDALASGALPGPRDLAPVQPLIGLGPGLTPSGDDAIGGALIAVGALGRDGLRDAIWSALEPAARRATNAISVAHLDAAAAGYGSAALHDVLGDLMAGETSDLAARLDAIGAIGHTSGWDALAGAAAALRARAASEGD